MGWDGSKCGRMVWQKLGRPMILGCFYQGQTPKSDIPPNVALKIVTPVKYFQIRVSSATLIGQLATVTIFGAILGGIPLSGAYPLNLVVFWADARKRY